MIDGLLILGFGGPTPGCCQRRPACAKTPGCEAECFVAGVLGDNPARAARIAEVAGHYHHFGGFSPYNELTERQAAALQAELLRRGRRLHIACGYRHWRPWAVDALRALGELGLVPQACRRGGRAARRGVTAPGRGGPAVVE
jgi:ferrochelatase